VSRSQRLPWLCRPRTRAWDAGCGDWLRGHRLPDATVSGDHRAALRQATAPHLDDPEGESLLNDASALLPTARPRRPATHAFSTERSRRRSPPPSAAPCWSGRARLVPDCRGRPHVPTSIIVQFISTLACGLSLSIGFGRADMVCGAGGPAGVRGHTGPHAHSPRRVGDGSFRVHVLAFVFIGLQIRPILTALDPAHGPISDCWRRPLTVIVARVAWPGLRRGPIKAPLRRPPPPCLPSAADRQCVLVVGWPRARPCCCAGASDRDGRFSFPRPDILQHLQLSGHWWRRTSRDRCPHLPPARDDPVTRKWRRRDRAGAAVAFLTA
jgi:hypothetical protein